MTVIIRTLTVVRKTKKEKKYNKTKTTKNADFFVPVDKFIIFVKCFIADDFKLTELKVGEVSAICVPSESASGTC